MAGRPRSDLVSRDNASSNENKCMFIARDTQEFGSFEKQLERSTTAYKHVAFARKRYFVIYCFIAIAGTIVINIGEINLSSGYMSYIYKTCPRIL